VTLEVVGMIHIGNFNSELPILMSPAGPKPKSCASHKDRRLKFKPVDLIQNDDNFDGRLAESSISLSPATFEVLIRVVDLNETDNF
jgi:hypothetical protein